MRRHLTLIPLLIASAVFPSVMPHRNANAQAANATTDAPSAPDQADVAPALAGNELYSRLEAACVEILVDGRQQGSGAIVDASGLVLTAAHVVHRPGQETRIEVLSPTLGRVPAVIAGMDRGHDLALLQMPFPETTGYAALPIARNAPQAGGEGFVFGAGLYRHGLMLHGSVARAEPTYEYLPTQQNYVRVLHIVGPAPKGVSGGPWVNQQGEVFAVQSGFISYQSSSVGVAFATPLDAIHQMLRRRNDAATPTLGLGLEELWEQSSSVVNRWPSGTSGLLPVVVVEDGPSDGLSLSRDTLIIAIDDTAVMYRHQLLDVVRAHDVGDTVTLHLLLPSGRLRTQEVTLGSLERR